MSAVAYLAQSFLYACGKKPFYLLILKLVIVSEMEENNFASTSSTLAQVGVSNDGNNNILLYFVALKLNESTSVLRDIFIS